VSLLIHHTAEDIIFQELLKRVQSNERGKEKRRGEKNVKGIEKRRGEVEKWNNKTRSAAKTCTQIDRYPRQAI
jgi:hypothetical protein